MKLADGEKEAKQKQIAEESLEPQKNKPDEEVEEVAVQRPWNLRPRKVVMVETSAAEATTVPPEKTTETPAPKSTRPRVLAENGGFVEKKERRKFRVALSKDEIEEDIFALTGSRPARRPKKRPKSIEKLLDVSKYFQVLIYIFRHFIKFNFVFACDDASECFSRVMVSWVDA